MEARERDEGPPQDLRLELDILWMLRQLSNRPGCDLGVSDEALNNCDGGGPDRSAQMHVARSVRKGHAAGRGTCNLSPEDARADRY